MQDLLSKEDHYKKGADERAKWDEMLTKQSDLARKRPTKAVNDLTCRIYSLRVFSTKLRTVMSSIIRRRSGLMGFSLIGVLLS
jgi:hypothetical protein